MDNDVGETLVLSIGESSYHYALPKQLEGQSSNPSQGGEGWSDSMSALRELVAMSEEHKISLIVFFRRSERGENNPLFEDVVRHANGVPVKDMGTWFEGLDQSSLVISKVDGRPNAEGHRVMAEHMADEIVSYLAARK